MPEDLYEEVRRIAARTGLSMADTMRQSVRLGLPKLEEQLSLRPELKPFTRDEIRRAYEVPNPEFDALEHHCAQLPVPAPEED